jgi:hypothetical protein
MSLRSLVWAFLLLLLAAPGCDDATKTCGSGDGAVTCQSDELCVASAEFVRITYRCARNPCPAEIDCSCAAPVCGGFMCSEAKGDQVSCYCAVC